MELEEVLSRIAARYGLSDADLRGETALPAARRFAPARPLAGDLPFHARLVMSPMAGHFADHYLAAPADGRHVIVTIAEYPSATDARTHLAMVLNNCMAILPRRRDLDAGELCFCGPDDPPLSAVFVRRNVFVEVASVGAVPVPIADIAAEVDRQILEHIELRTGA